MISHRHRCIFIHVPKTAGKSLLTLFGLPVMGRDYRGELEHIEDPYDHIPVTRYAGRPYFDEYFKFAIVRNPWDRVVSAFHYLDAGGANALDARFRQEHLAEYEGDFARFVDDLPRVLKTRHFMPQTRLVCDEDGRILVDYLGRFENLAATVDLVAERCGLGEVTLPYTNASRHAPYQEYYDDATRRRVAEVYARDVRLLGYAFE